MSAAKLSDPNYVLLYVQNPAVSVTFYEGLLGKPPVENSPTFAMFALQSGVMLGLWARDTVEPKALAAGGSELAFTLADGRASRPFMPTGNGAALPSRNHRPIWTSAIPASVLIRTAIACAHLRRRRNENR